MYALTAFSILSALARFSILGGFATSIFSAFTLLSGRISCRLSPITFSSETIQSHCRRCQQKCNRIMVHHAHNLNRNERCIYLLDSLNIRWIHAWKRYHRDCCQSATGNMSTVPRHHSWFVQRENRLYSLWLQFVNDSSCQNCSNRFLCVTHSIVMCSVLSRIDLAVHSENDDEKNIGNGVPQSI